MFCKSIHPFSIFAYPPQGHRDPQPIPASMGARQAIAQEGAPSDQMAHRWSSMRSSQGERFPKPPWPTPRRWRTGSEGWYWGWRVTWSKLSKSRSGCITIVPSQPGWETVGTDTNRHLQALCHLAGAVHCGRDGGPGKTRSAGWGRHRWRRSTVWISWRGGSNLYLKC